MPSLSPAARLLCRRVLLYSISCVNGMALCTMMLLAPDLAVANFSTEPDACAEPGSAACRSARSRASFVLGCSNSAKALLALLLGPILGTISDFHGRRFYWLGSQVGALLGYAAALLHAYGFCSLWPFLILNSLGGLLFPALLAVISDEFEREQRATAFGLLMASLDVGILLGPAVAGRLGFQAAMVLTTACGAAALFLAIGYGETLPASQRCDQVAASARWRPDVALSILGSTPLFRRLSVIILASTIPIAGQQQCFMLFLEVAYGLDRAKASGLIVVLALSGLVVQLFVLPVLLTQVTVTKVLFVGLVLQLLQAALLTFCHSTVGIVFSCIMGGFGSLVFPCVCALKANAAPEREQGRIQGAVSSLQSAALGFGPVIYGTVFAYCVGPKAPGGHPIPAATFGLSILVLIVALITSITLEKHVPAEMKCRVPMPRRAVSLWRIGDEASPGSNRVALSADVTGTLS